MSVGGVVKVPEIRWYLNGHRRLIFHYILFRLISIGRLIVPTSLPVGRYLSRRRRLMNECLIIYWSLRESLQNRFFVGPEEPTSGSGGREKDHYNAVKVVPGDRAPVACVCSINSYSAHDSEVRLRFNINLELSSHGMYIWLSSMTQEDYWHY